MLNNGDVKHWRPLAESLDYVASLIPPGAKVLEVGPGMVPFSRATAFVDHIAGENIIVCDILKDALPFPDKHFDFIYCRHVVEDLSYPFRFLQEMSRVGKAGFIETPSVVAELCRGIDGNSPPFRGYAHHQWFVWNHDGQLKFIKKYPYVEYMDFNDDVIEGTLKGSAAHWNTYMLWEDVINFDQIVTGIVCPEYMEAIKEAAVQGIQNTSKFIEKYPRPRT